MKIECLQRRKGGSTGYTRGGTAAYHFKPDDQGRLVAEITNQEHAAHFLGIPEGYRFLKTNDTDTIPEGVRLIAGNIADPDAVDRLESELQVSKLLVEKLSADLKESRERIAAQASEIADLKRRIDLADTALDGEPDAPTEVQVPTDEPKADAPDAKPEKSAERLKLEDAHKAKFGRKPHHNLSDEKIAAMLASKA